MAFLDLGRSASYYLAVPVPPFGLVNRTKLASHFESAMHCDVVLRIQVMLTLGRYLLQFAFDVHPTYLNHALARDSSTERLNLPAAD